MSTTTTPKEVTMKLKDSVALVTGANRGLGQAIVAELLNAGVAKVYATARDAKNIAVEDPRVVVLALDVTRPESIAAAADKASDVSLLVNNAGVLTAYGVLAASRADFEADFRTNVLGTLGVTKAFVPALEQAAEGATVVNVLSVVALASLPAMGGYAASKAAAYSVTQALRAELRAKRVSVLAALPGPIDTDMIRHLPIPKTSAAETAAGIVAGIGRGEEEIFPSAQTEPLGALWRKSPKECEKIFASF